MFYDFLRIIFKPFYCLFFRFEVIGEENIPEKGPVIIASNHVSLLDPPTIGVASKRRKVGFMAKSELFKNPLFSAIITNLGAFPVRRDMSDAKAVKTALTRLKNGLVVGVFPEGTRNGNLDKAEPGVLAMAARTGAAVVPTAVIGTEKFSLTNLFPKVIVAFSKPLYVDSADKDLLAEKMKYLTKQIKTLLTTYKKD